MSIDNTSRDVAFRELALDRLKKQADFKLHAMIYLLVNGFLVVIWWMTGMPFFWPIFPIFGWGIGVAANWWDAYLRAVPTEVEINREMAKLRSRGAMIPE